MIKHIFNHWHKENRWVYMTAETPPTKETKTTVPKTDEITVKGNLDNPEKRRAVMQQIDKKYGSQAFKQKTEKFVQNKKYANIANSSTINTIMEQVQQTYVKNYRGILDQLNVHLDTFNENYRIDIGKIKETTQESLNKLKEGLNAGLEVKKESSNLTDANKENIEPKFKSYIDALSKNYMPDATVRESDLGVKFTNGIKRLAQETIKAKITDESKAVKVTTKNLDKKIVEQYKKTAGKDGVINQLELTLLERNANLGSNLQNLTELTNLKTENNSINLLEKVMIMNPDTWVQVYSHMKDSVLKSAENYNPTAFIAFAKKDAQKTGSASKIDSYKSAKTYFESQLNSLAKYDVKGTIEFVQGFSSAIDKPMNDYIDEKVPESLQTMVMEERANLLTGRAQLPQKSPDQLVVNFVRSDLSDKRTILNNPQQREELWIGTKTILDSYQKQYDKNYARRYKKNPRARTNIDPNSPTQDDYAARLLAVITLAKETENFMNREFPKQNKIRTYLEGIQIDRTPMKANTDWVFGGEKVVSGVPVAALAGFNMKNMGKRVLQGALIATIIFNAANAFKDFKSDGIEGVMQKLISNPTTGAALAGFYLTKRPEIVRGVLGKESSGDAERIGFGRMLSKVENKLAKKEPQASSHIRLLINNESEWQAINTIRSNGKSPKNIKNMLRKIKKTQGNYPKLSRKTLEDFAGTPLQLADDPASNRARFEIYNTLFTKKVNLLKLKGDAQAWAQN